MKKYIYPILTVLALLIGFFIGNGVTSRANANNPGFSRRVVPSKMDQLLLYMSLQYVDTIDTDSIAELVMEDVVSKLDPHSAYIPQKDLAIVNSELDASFSGIGVQFTIQQDTINVVAVISGGPSEGVGLLAGDKIVEVDDSVFVGKGVNNEKVMHTLRGPKGTKVKLGVIRAGAKDMLHFTVTRGDIPIHTVDAVFMADKEVGFIRVNRFAANTYDEFITGLAELKSKGAKRYIVDLRENSGGYMDQAIKMANEFLSASDMIVYSKGRSYPYFEAKANGLGRFKNVPLVVLIDEFSASASEIFAGAMQDNDRATVIGRRSFGKGLVQQQYPFLDGSALRLTVARYYTPSGRCIQKPYEMGKQDDYRKDVIERFEHGEMFSADSINLKDSTVYYTKGGRIVYGGGGIMPDIFVGRDTTLYTPFYNMVINQALTYQFAHQYTNKHRAELKEISDWREMEKYLNKQNWFPEFITFCSGRDIEPNKAQVEKSKPLIKRLINAYIIRNILTDNDFFELMERDDEITKRAIKEIKLIKYE